MNKVSAPLTAALLAVSMAPCALGDVIITNNAGTLQASALASVGNPFSFDLDNPAAINLASTGIPSTIGDTLTASASATDNDGTSAAEMSSTVASDVSQLGQVVTIKTSVEYITSQSSSPGPSTDDFDNANAEGSARIEVSFNLDMDYNYTFNAPGAQASGTPELEFRLDVISGGDDFDASLQNQSGDLAFSGFLPAGTGYKLVINVDDSDNDGSRDGASANGLASFTDAELVLTPVPEPTSLALLSLAGLAIARRRR